ncbi:MAG: V-type ATP synthase subunit E family protein [Oscillospiraceae bacterium]|nr:V-type ATP synthase subunit E family protein [Oscillospiraceae bacterium]
MIEMDHRAEQFLVSIRDEGEQDCTEIRAKTESAVAAVLERTWREEQEKAERTIRFESARSEVQGNKTLSQRRAAVRAELAKQREDLQGEIFSEAEAQLRAFTESGDYPGWLADSAASLAKAMGPGTVLYARTVDLPLLREHLPAGCTLEADDTIHLGGLRARGSVSAADDTQESRLERQRSWFLEHSGLSIAL